MITDRGVVAGNVYDKYNTQNPIARAMMDGFLQTVRRLYLGAAAEAVLEVGCGEGHLLGELVAARRPPVVIGTDVSAEIVGIAAEAHPELPFCQASAYALPFDDGAFDLVLACEVMEHLERPEEALREIARVTRDEVILTVPREPLWRALNMARLRYLGDLGNTPGHIQHFSRDGFCRLVARHFDIIEVASPVPWTAVRARRRR